MVLTTFFSVDHEQQHHINTTNANESDYIIKKQRAQKTDISDIRIPMDISTDSSTGISSSRLKSWGSDIRVRNHNQKPS